MINPEEHNPTTLPEAVDLIAGKLDDDEIAWVKKHDPCSAHFTLGMAIRNAWLWNDKHPLHKFFNDVYGLGHADDMSSMILIGVGAKVRGLECDFAAEAKHYHQFWAKQGIDPLTLKEKGGAIPLAVKVPNAETRAAMAESRKIMAAGARFLDKVRYWFFKK